MSKIIEVQFYQSESGKEPVRDWLLEMEPEERRAIGTGIKQVEFGWPIGLPFCEQVKGHRGLFCVRINLQKKWARVLFCLAEGPSCTYMILLHGFWKKTNKTPKQDIDLAKQRMKYMAEV